MKSNDSKNDNSVRNMDDNQINNIDDIDIEYSIVVKNIDDIILDITNDSNEKIIYESIINGIELHASEVIKSGKIAQLPSIGCLRKDPLRQVIRDNHKNFTIARKNMTSSQYKEHVKEIIIDARQKQNKSDKHKQIIRLIKSRNKKHYDRLYITLGRAYAEMYILSIYMLKEVPYVFEIQEQFDRINGI